jgi:putative component of membrane protein insertase Oxa1/YidC/SpoIIIJ protein YidD
VNASTEPVRSEAAAAARTFLKVIAIYQRLTAGRVSACRFYPSCCAFALRRLSRCRPLGPHGVDLVPQSKEARSTQR